MKITRLLAAAVLVICSLLVACSEKEKKEEKEKDTITHAQLVEMFDNVAKHSNWDMSKPMRWGYFFTYTDREKLDEVSPLLEKQGYKLVGIYNSKGKDKNESDVWWLHVEKVEIHNPDSLYERNQLLEEFAAEHDLQSYDGMDVNPTESSTSP